MNRQEHLLTIAAEECAEVAQRIAKALRFGMEQVQEDADDQPQENPERLTNAQRIVREYNDLKAMMEMLDLDISLPEQRDRKKVKVLRYLQRSERCGTLVRDQVLAGVSAPQEPALTMADAAEMLWVVLANVSGGDWTQQTPEWQEAAARWRDNYFDALKARAAGVSLPVPQGWQPIATAPKMRTILLFAITDVADDGTVRNWKMATGSYHTGYEDERSKELGISPWNWDGHQLKFYELFPTHWMPLPAPPAHDPAPVPQEPEK